MPAGATLTSDGPDVLILPSEQANKIRTRIQVANFGRFFPVLGGITGSA